jgi:regulatory protein
VETRRGARQFATPIGASLSGLPREYQSLLRTDKIAPEPLRRSSSRLCSVRRKARPDPGDQEACHDAALRALGLRWHGDRELSLKLRSKGYDAEAIAAALARLRQEGWLDDRRYAEAYARGRARKHFGPERVRAELIGRGIDDRTAAAAVKNVFADEQTDATLEKLCIRKAGLGRNKLTAHLLKLGYDYAAVSAAVRNVLRDTPQEED